MYIYIWHIVARFGGRDEGLINKQRSLDCALWKPSKFGLTISFSL